MLLLVVALAVAHPLHAAPTAKRTTVRRTGPATAPKGPVLPFIADDYTKAVAEARARKVPLFIEAWAPW